MRKRGLKPGKTWLKPCKRHRWGRWEKVEFLPHWIGRRQIPGGFSKARACKRCWGIQIGRPLSGKPKGGGKGRGDGIH